MSKEYQQVKWYKDEEGNWIWNRVRGYLDGKYDCKNNEERQKKILELVKNHVKND